MAKTRGYNNYRGQNVTSLAKRLALMKSRCKPNHVDAHLYYDKGIEVCKEWSEDSKNFIDWCLDNGWTEGCGLSIDRIDGSKGYYPNNCRLADNKIQSRNKINSYGRHADSVGVWESCGVFNSAVSRDGAFIYWDRFKTKLDAERGRDKFIIDNNLESEYVIKYKDFDYTDYVSKRLPKISEGSYRRDGSLQKTGGGLFYAVISIDGKYHSVTKSYKDKEDAIKERMSIILKHKPNAQFR